ADPQKILSKHLPCLQPSGSTLSDLHQCAEKSLHSLATVAFRRSTSASDIQNLLIPFDRAIEKGMEFRAALSLSLQALLMSPRFLYRLEFSGNSGTDTDVNVVDDFEFATRLSYFLWGSLPDDEL